MEGGLTESRQKLKDEQKLRRAAEQAQDEADQRVRELTQSLQQVREECDDVHEELAFRENELEELRLELEVEKQQLQNELAAAKQETRQAVAAGGSAGAMESSAKVAAVATGVGVGSTAAQEEAEEYAKKLEEELELVTEQLIETEKRLAECEQELQDKTRQLENVRSSSNHDESNQELIHSLQVENADRLDAEQRLREEVTVLKEELALSKEEVALQQEELQAAEEDYKTTAMQLEEEKARHKDQVHKLTIQIKEAEQATKSSLGNAAMVASTVQQASDENAQLADEVAALESALELSKKDYQDLLDELDAVNARFDEARKEARREGEEAALEKATLEKATKQADNQHELQQVQQALEKLQQENATLQERLDQTEVALAVAKDQQEHQQDPQDSAVVQQLQSQLARAREDLKKKDAEIAELQKAMQGQLKQAEENISALESQLRATKGNLAEAEARFIVVQREKDRAENKIPLSPKKPKATIQDDGKSIPKAPSMRSSTHSIDREELDGVDNRAVIRRTRSRSSSPSSVMRLEYRIKEEQDKLAKLQKEYNSLQDQKRMGEVRIKRLEGDLKTLQKQLFATGGDGTVVTQMTRLSSLGHKNEGVDVMLLADDKLASVDELIESRDMKAMATELKSLAKKCNSQRDYNAQLLSKMLHLQGNIQVYCRIRPMSLAEIEKGHKSIAEPLSETEVGCYDNRTNKWKSFAFDRVWGPDQSQQSVFQDVEPLALSVVDGFNACIFA